MGGKAILFIGIDAELLNEFYRIKRKIKGPSRKALRKCTEEALNDWIRKNRVKL